MPLHYYLWNYTREESPKVIIAYEYKKNSSNRKAAVAVSQIAL
jgi:hypothetical protein